METSLRKVTRRCVWLLIVSALAGISPACTSMPTHESVDLSLSVDEESYRIGEPVRATVEVRNRAEGTLLIPALDQRTLTFYARKPSSRGQLERRPVLPAEAPARVRLAQGEEAASRTFLFTRLTTEPGQWAVTAALRGCRQGGAEGEKLPPLYAPHVAYRVTEEVLFRRDPYSGVIVRQQAEALVRKRKDVPEGAKLQSALVPLAGSKIYEWIVVVESDGKDSGVFAVNPYSGAVKAVETDLLLRKRKEQ